MGCGCSNQVGDDQHETPLTNSDSSSVLPSRLQRPPLLQRTPKTQTPLELEVTAARLVISSSSPPQQQQQQATPLLFHLRRASLQTEPSVRSPLQVGPADEGIATSPHQQQLLATVTPSEVKGQSVVASYQGIPCRLRISIPARSCSVTEIDAASQSGGFMLDHAPASLCSSALEGPLDNNEPHVHHRQAHRYQLENSLSCASGNNNASHGGEGWGVHPLHSSGESDLVCIEQQQPHVSAERLAATATTRHRSSSRERREELWMMVGSNTGGSSGGFGGSGGSDMNVMCHSSEH